MCNEENKEHETKNTQNPEPQTEGSEELLRKVEELEILDI